MKIAHRIALTLGLLVVLVCSWTAPIDAQATAHVDAGLKRALVSFATARTLNGVLSVIQAAQVDIQPAGVGVTLSPGQLLAPVNELVRHFADLMLLACVTFGVLKVLISISGYWMISALLTVLALAWGAAHVRQGYAARWLSTALVLVLMLRFAVPLAMLGTEALSQKFLAADYAAAQSAIDTTATQASRAKLPERPASDAKSWLPHMPTWVPDTAALKDWYARTMRSVEQSIEHMVKLMVVFLLQTLLLPLLLVSVLYWIAKACVYRPGWSPVHAPGHRSLAR